MNQPFQISIDQQGNFIMGAGSIVALHATTEVFMIDGGAATVVTPAARADDSLRAPSGAGAMFAGGSGRNYRLRVDIGGPVPGIPEGFFKEVEPKRWNSATAAGWRLDMDPGTGDLSLSDGTDVLADSAGFATVSGTRSAGTFPNQNWILESAVGFIRIYRGASDSTKLIIHDASSGNSSVVHDISFHPIALRAAIDYDSPSGSYAASSDGEDDFNGGSPWTYTVTGGGLSGSLSSTSYGATTYNGGNPFTLAAGFEGGGDLPGAAVQALGGASFAAGIFAAASHVSYQDSGRTITIADDGSATIEDGTGVVATRAADASLLYNPGGSFISTTYGADTFNGGGSFEIEVSQATTHPIAGFLYVTVLRDAVTDEATGTAGPFFAISMPANTATECHWPIVKSDGEGGVVSLQTTAILWRPQP